MIFLEALEELFTRALINLLPIWNFLNLRTVVVVVRQARMSQDIVKNN